MQNAQSRGEAHPHLALFLLGPMELRVDDAPVVLPARKVRALLAYLARRPDSAITRDTLCGLLWGDRAEAQARASLRQTLAALRKLLGPAADAVLTVTGNDIRFNGAAAWIDAGALEHFTSTESESDQDRAIALYRGDFLEGLPAIDPEFDRWLAMERANLRETHARFLHTLAQGAEQAGQTERVISLATRQLALDPLQENVHRRLMRAYAGQGRYDAALKQFEQLSRLLAEILGVQPEPATLDLFREIRGQRARGAEQTSAESRDKRAEAADSAPALLIPKRPSIAVHAFRALGSGEDMSYFGEGVAEDIVIELSRSPDLFVVSPQSSFKYSEADSTPEDIGRNLGVRFCLSGSVRRAGEKLRVSSHLVSCETGREIWAERFDRDMEDIFDVQTEIARTVTATVVGRISASESTSAQRPPENMDAYDYLLRALQRIHRYTREDGEEATRLIDRALQLDPDYGRAHGLKAISQIYTGWYYVVTNEVATARESAERALRLDSNDTMAHCALAMVMLISRDFPRAGYHFEQALALNPNDDFVLVEYARYLMYTGRCEDGIRRLREAMRLNPYHPNWYWNIYGRCLHTLGRHAEAIAVFEKVANPPFWTLIYMAGCHAGLDNLDQAKDYRDRALALKPDFDLDEFKRIFPYQDPGTATRYFTTLEKAMTA